MTRNDFEQDFLEATRRAGLPPPEINAYIEAGGRRFEVDCVWREQRVFVELDGGRSVLADVAAMIAR